MDSMPLLSLLWTLPSGACDLTNESLLHANIRYLGLVSYILQLNSIAEGYVYLSSLPGVVRPMVAGTKGLPLTTRAVYRTALRLATMLSTIDTCSYAHPNHYPSEHWRISA